MSGTIETYRRLCAEFKWNMPALYNAGANACGRYARSLDDTAITMLNSNGKITRYSYSNLDVFSNKLANRFKASGLSKADRVAVLLPPSFAAAAAYVGALKAGLIVVPLFAGTTSGVLEQRLRSSGAKILLIAQKNLAVVEEIQPVIADLSIEVLLLLGDAIGSCDFLEAVTDTAQSTFDSTPTTPHDPAFLAFTSGSEGEPKGVLHAHREMIGAVSTFNLRSRPLSQGEVHWSPSEWGWLMGLNIAFTTWLAGGSVLLQEALAFDPGSTLKLMEEFSVNHASLTPTALTLMHKTDNKLHRPGLYSISTGGETIGRDVFEWVEERFGIPLDEFFGMSECPGLIGNGDLVEPRRGSLGLPLPGHDVQIVDEQGRILPRGDLGYIAVNRSDPGLFLGHWVGMRPEAPEMSGDYYITKDLARQDEDGYFWYVSRGDDVIKSGGYRIGPSEIEDCVISHPSVQLAGVVGQKDPIMGQVVKLWIKLKDDCKASADLEQSIRAHIRQRLPSHQWPRTVQFIEKMPLTASGKISRRELKNLN